MVVTGGWGGGHGEMQVKRYKSSVSEGQVLGTERTPQ